MPELVFEILPETQHPTPEHLSPPPRVLRVLRVLRALVFPQYPHPALVWTVLIVVIAMVSSLPKAQRPWCSALVDWMDGMDWIVVGHIVMV